ncbi:MAG TPA: lipid-binding SYLF domain-containing protein [Casimicrobiaceae bacterium]|nr:lipid-binding SYLF domain-containing protein [Casimicrobiaceae bacterium]
MFRSVRTLSTMAMTALAAAVLLAAPAQAQSPQQTLVNSANTTLSNFLRDPDMSWLQANFGRARAVLIAPSIARAGFIFGGSGGRAVLIARDQASGKWVGPAFYTMATASVGFQAGVSVSENVTLVMTEKALNSLLTNNVRVGGDASVAAGPVGAGARSDIVADLITFSRARGVFGGLNLDGTVIAPSNDWNNAYFGKEVLPPDILIRMSVKNKKADPLLARATKATTAKAAK